MFVDTSMTKRVITIREETGVLEAKRLMNEHKIRHLPVVDDDSKLLGIVTDRDIRSALPSILMENFDSADERERLAGLPVREIMTKNPVVIKPSYTIHDALLLIQEKKVGAFPVVNDDGKLEGMLSIRDLMRAFTNVLNIGEPGTLIGILVEQKVGQLKKIVDAVTEENISFGSILVARHWDEAKRAVFIYLMTNNIIRIKKKLQDMGFTLLDPMAWYLDRLPQND